MRSETALMAYDDKVAIPALLPGELHCAITSRFNPCADRRAVVDTFMCSPSLQNGVEARD